MKLVTFLWWREIRHPVENPRKDVQRKWIKAALVWKNKGRRKLSTRSAIHPQSIHRPAHTMLFWSSHSRWPLIHRLHRAYCCYQSLTC